MDKELVSSNEYDEFVAKLPPEEQAQRGWVIRSNASKTRTHKYETILEYWGEGWESGSVGDMWDELMRLHTGETPLYQYDDEALDAEYENALEYFKELDGEQE